MNAADRGNGSPNESGSAQFSPGREVTVGTELVMTEPQADHAKGASGAPSSIALRSPCKPSRELLVAHMPGHAYSERMRHLRTELMLRHTPGRAECLALALISPAREEGRTVLAAELALTFSQLGRRTLLIDGDMRRPRQHQLFQIPQQDGLSRLISEFTPQALLRVEGFPALHVLTAGHAVEQNPSELFSDGRFDALIRKFRELFDFIVVDTPGFTEFTDARVISTVIGNVVTVNRAGHTSLRASREMLAQLKPSGASVMGAVLSDF